MASLALRLPVFVASPGDVMAERRRAEQIIWDQARGSWRHSLLIHPFLWERDVGPTGRAVQPEIDVLLAEAELAIFIFGERIGRGTCWELERALEMVGRGQADNLWVYHRAGKSSPDLLAQLGLSPSAGARSYTDEEDFTQRLRHDLSVWVTRWEKVPEIWKAMLANGPGTVDPLATVGARYANIREALGRLDPGDLSALARDATDAYQKTGPEAFQLPLPARFDAEPRRRVLALGLESGLLRRSPGGEVAFAGADAFFLLCAWGLVDAILADRRSAVSKCAYINPIHQRLRVLGAQQRDALGAALRRWLSDPHEPVVRNFAAYVLGMLEVREAEDDLARALQHDKDVDVKRYAITSLGKLRSRRYLGVLVKFFHETLHADLRQVAGQAICRICGVAEFQM